MPLIVWAYLGYVGGLLVGFSRSWVLICGAVGGAAYLGIWYRSGEMLGVGLLVVAGVSLASVTPVLVTRQVVRRTAGDTTTFLGRERVRVGRTIDSVFQGDAPVAKALLIADKTELPYDVKQRYVAAGIAHRLSISGLHVAMVAMAIEMLFRFLRVSRRAAILTSIGAVGCYVALIGFPLPAVRAGAMFVVIRISRLLQRPASPWAILAGCGFIPLIDPSTILTVGYQLNMVGVASFMAGTSLARRVFTKREREWQKRLVGWKGRVARTLLISIVATVLTTPLVAWWFGKISLIAPVTNVLVEPLFELTQPLLFLGILCAPWHALSSILADAVHPLLAVIDWIATVMAALPYASVTVKPAAIEGVLAAIASTAALVACVSRTPARAILLASTAACALIVIG